MRGSRHQRRLRIDSLEIIKLKCHRLVKGKAEGEALISHDPICFYLVDPKTGKVIEPYHELEGQSIAGKVLIFPGGKGSSVVQADGLYQLKMNGTAPKAMIVQNPDTVTIASAVLMEFPVVDRLESKFYETLKPGDFLKVDADNETVTIIKK